MKIFLFIVLDFLIAIAIGKFLKHKTKKAMTDEERVQMYFQRFANMLKHSPINEVVIVFKDAEGTGVMHLGANDFKTPGMMAIAESIVEIIAEDFAEFNKPLN